MASDGGLTGADASSSSAAPESAGVSRRGLRNRALFRWLVRHWLAAPTSAGAVALHLAHVPHVWALHSWLLRVAVAAVGVRAGLHSLMHYGPGARTSLRGEWVCFVLMTGDLAASAATGADRTWAPAAAFLAIACLYEFVNNLLATRRDKLGLPTATSWIAGWRFGEDTLAEIFQHQQGGVISPVADETMSEAVSTTPTKSKRGGSAAGALLIACLSYGGVAYAASSIVAPNTPAPPSTHSSGHPKAAASSGRALARTYDDLCGGRHSRQPGDGAPGWATAPINRLWFEPQRGVGGYLAGCAQPAHPVPGHPDVVYQPGKLHGSLLSVAVSIEYGPTTLYLDGAAAIVLDYLQRGVVVAGPNDGHITGAELTIIREPGGTIYVPSPTASP